MEELMEALGEVIVWRNVLEKLWEEKSCDQDAVRNLSEAKSDLAKALEAYIDSRIEAALLAERERMSPDL